MNKFVEELKKKLEEHEDLYVHDDSDYGEGKYNAFQEVKKIVNQLTEEYNNGWIPVDMEVPPNDNYVLVSFENFNLPDIARYEEDSEGGVFYPGDEEKSYASFGLFVNAWQPLPEPYRPKGESDDHSKNG